MERLYSGSARLLATQALTPGQVSRTHAACGNRSVSRFASNTISAEYYGTDGGNYLGNNINYKDLLSIKTIAKRIVDYERDE